MQLQGEQMSSNTRKFESLLGAVPDALVGMDQKGAIRFVNHQTESLFGYDRDNLVGQPIQTLVPEYLWEVYSEHREEYFADPRSRSMGLDLELGGRQQDGSELPVNISLSHLDTGDVLLVITAVREVTRHAQALENSKLLAAIVENSNDAIIAKTFDGIVTYWNPAAERREAAAWRSPTCAMRGRPATPISWGAPRAATHSPASGRRLSSR